MSGLARPGVPQALVLASGLRLDDTRRPPARGGEGAAGDGAAPGVDSQGRRSHHLADRAHQLRFPDPARGGHARRLGAAERRHAVQPEIAREQRRSLAYAALDAIGRHTLETGSTGEIARTFAMGSTKHTARRVATVQRWYAHLADARVGRPSVAALRCRRRLRSPGPRPGAPQLRSPARPGRA